MMYDCDCVGCDVCGVHCLPECSSGAGEDCSACELFGQHFWEHEDTYFNHNRGVIYDLYVCECGAEKENHQ
jgi:hypothetical protein